MVDFPIPLITADAHALVTTLEGAFLPPWGVYLYGIPIIAPSTSFTRNVSAVLSSVIAPLQTFFPLLGGQLPNMIPVAASTARFSYRQDWTIADYPIEQGGFQSYDKVQLPFDVRAKFVNSGDRSQRQVFINTVEAMCNSLLLFDLITPEKVYLSLSASHMDFDREAVKGATMLQIDVWFVQIRETATALFSNTLQPMEAGLKSAGNVQTQVPGQSVSSAAAGGFT